ncbi:MAG: phosphatidate cytidylyltransferase [Clostridia bacterium]|nr:phosphatidate cytidylyltransferase [Clostridia bacterium]
MKKRLITASLLLFILGGAFSLRLINNYGIYIFDLFVGILAIFASLEFAKLMEKSGNYISHLATGLYPSLMFAGHVFFFSFNLSYSYYIVIQLSLLLFAFLVTFVTLLFVKDKGFLKYLEKNKLSRAKGCFKAALKTLLSLIYPTTFLLGLMLLNRIDLIPLTGINSFTGNLSWLALIVVFLIPIITDSSAMLCGSAIKGPKLCPNISPNKTVSGAICGVVLSSIILGALYYVFNAFGVIGSGFAFLGIKSYHFVLLGFFGSIISQMGDIFESFLKRKAKVKDSGHIFPGHGGFLDRLDSHIFCAPFVFIYLILIIVL